MSFKTHRSVKKETSWFIEYDIDGQRDEKCIKYILSWKFYYILEYCPTAKQNKR